MTGCQGFLRRNLYCFVKNATELGILLLVLTFCSVLALKMHRATERRWSNVFIFSTSLAFLCQILGFILPAWVRIYFKINTRRVAQDYALWYMTQCESENWTCKTRSYYQLYDWTRNEIMFEGVPLGE